MQKQESKPEPISTVKLDPRFKFEVAKTPGGEGILRCFQCGRCTATCPIRRFDSHYKPRMIIRYTLLGLRERVLSSDEIWLCASCYSCTERCAQEVRLTDVMKALRSIAVAEGHVHPFFKAQADTILQHGRIYPDDGFINEMRSDLGLPSVPPVNLEEMRGVMEAAKASSQKTGRGDAG